MFVKTYRAVSVGWLAVLLIFSLLYIGEAYPDEPIIKAYVLSGLCAFSVSLVMQFTVLKRKKHGTVISTALSALPALLIGLTAPGLFFRPWVINRPEVGNYWLPIQMWNWFAWANIICTAAYFALSGKINIYRKKRQKAVNI